MLYTRVNFRKPILALMEILADDIENCIDQIDDGEVEGARSDLVLILRELKGDSDDE